MKTKENFPIYKVCMYISILIFGTSFALNIVLWIFEWLYRITGINLNLSGVSHETWILFTGSILGGLVAVFGVYLTIKDSNKKYVLQKKIEELEKMVNMHNENLKVFHKSKLIDIGKNLSLQSNNCDIDKLFAYIQNVTKELNNIEIDMSIAEHTMLLALNYSNNDEYIKKYREVFYEIYNTYLETMGVIIKLSVDLSRGKILGNKIKKVEEKKDKLQIGTPEWKKLSDESTSLHKEQLNLIYQLIDWRKYDISIYIETLKKLGVAILKYKQEEIDTIKFD